MSGVVSAADANRMFSAILRRVKGGDTVVITSHGRPVARLVPVRAEEKVATRARRELLARIADQRVVRVTPWTRDELHER